MATPTDKYYTKMLETLVDYNDHHIAIFSNENLRQSIFTVMAETKEKERNIILDTNNVTMDIFYLSPATINTQRENTNVILKSERVIS